MGQNVVCGRRGVERNKVGGCRTTGLARKPPPSGGGGWWFCAAGAILALQPCLGLSGAQGKIHKNIQMMETQS